MKSYQRRARESIDTVIEEIEEEFEVSAKELIDHNIFSNQYDAKKQLLITNGKKQSLVLKH